VKGFKGKTEGFSLIELLVVLMIMGLLSGGLMIAASRAMASAEAVRIISDLRSIKVACLMFSMEEDAEINDPSTFDITCLETYLDRKIQAESFSLYGNEEKLFIGCGPIKKKVSRYIEQRAEENGLYGSSSSSEEPQTPYVSGEEPWVWIRVM